VDVVVGVQLIERYLADVFEEEESLVGGFGEIEHHLLHIGGVDHLIGEVVEGISGLV